MAKDLTKCLIVQTTQVPEEGREISEDLPREWLSNIPEFSSDDTDTHIEGQIRVRGRVMKEGENLRVQGQVTADLVTFCTRCGETIHYPLSGKFEVMLIKGEESDLEEDEELTPEEASSIYYNGIEADLAPFFQEEIALQVPMQTLCRPDCAGLCASCGANLNVEKCKCEKQEGDPRLTVLRNLKLNG